MTHGIRRAGRPTGHTNVHGGVTDDLRGEPAGFCGLAEAAEPTLSSPSEQQNGEHSTVGELNRVDAPSAKIVSLPANSPVRSGKGGR
jgi:hypothetical protein